MINIAWDIKLFFCVWFGETKLILSTKIALSQHILSGIPTKEFEDIYQICNQDP